MPDNKTAVEQFLEGTQSKEEKMFEFETPKETEQATEEQGTEEQKEEKPIPFNKDPKVLKFIEKEISRRLENHKPETPQQTQAEDEFKDVMDSMVLAIGNDTPEKVSALNAFKNALTGLDKRATDRAISHLEEIREREAEEDRQAEEELEDAFDAIEDNYDVDITSNSPIAKKTRQDFVSFIEKIAPKDSNGDIVDYPDLISSWETFTEMQKSKSPASRAKDLASRSMARSSETTIKQPEKVNWDKVDEYMDSLK